MYVQHDVDQNHKMSFLSFNQIFSEFCFSAFEDSPAGYLDLGCGHLRNGWLCSSSASPPSGRRRCRQSEQELAVQTLDGRTPEDKEQVFRPADHGEDLLSTTTTTSLTVLSWIPCRIWSSRASRPTPDAGGLWFCSTFFS